MLLFDFLFPLQNDVLTIWLAVLAIFCIDFSINAGRHSLFFSLSSHISYGGPPQCKLQIAHCS